MKSSRNKTQSKGRPDKSGLSVFRGLPPFVAGGLFLIVILTLMAYFPVFSHGFTNWDDPIYVTANTLIREGTFAQFWTTPVASNYHPLTMFSLALDYKLFGDSATGYLITNIIFHLCNVVLLGCVMHVLFPGKEYITLAVCALFALHPLHVESVAWVSERKDVLYVFFLFLAWFFWLRWENENKTLWFAAAILFFVASCLSKGMAVVFPGLILVTSWMRSIPLQRRYFIHWIPVFLIALIFGAVAIRTQADAGALAIENVQLSVIDRIITALHGYVFYLEKMLFPVGLSAYYPYPVNFNISWPLRYALAPLVLLLLLISAWYFGRNQKVILAGTLLYLGILLPVSQILSVGNAMAADRYFYLSSVGPFLILGYLFQKYADQKKSGREMLIAVLLGISVLLAFISRERVKVWENSVTLFTDVISKYPASAVAYHGLGEAYNSEGKYTEALKQFELALKYRPGYPDVLYNIGVVYDRLNRYKESIPYYIDAIQKKPGYVEAFYNVANSYYMVQNYDSSLYYFEETLKLKPDHTGALNNMASIFFDIQDFDRALMILKKTIEVNPAQEEAMFNIGSIYFQKKEYPQALSWFEKCIQQNPGFADNHRMAGLALSESGDIQNAIPYFKKAASLGDPMATQWLREKGIQ